MPYSPQGCRMASSVTGTSVREPCTQMDPQLARSDTRPLNPSTSCSAESGVKQIMSTTTSAFRSVTRPAKVPARSPASRSIVTVCNFAPRWIVPVLALQPPAECDDLVARGDESWHKVPPDVSSGTDHNYPHGSITPCLELVVQLKVSTSSPVRRPRLRQEIAAISSSLRTNPAMSILFSIRSGEADFGRATLPACRCQRR